MLKNSTFLPTKLATLLATILLSYPGMSQNSGRPGPDNTGPIALCSPVFQQTSAANYVASYHLSGSFGAADIGVSGSTTVIDISSYSGRLLFSGRYHVRGNVRFINGTAEMLPGTVFDVEGLNGQTIPGTSFQDNTTIEVEDAALELTGAVIQSTCPRAWGGIKLLDYGRIRTRADATAGRSSIRDAIVGIDVTPQSYQYSTYSTGEYYLNGTDFVNNGTGVYDYFKSVARAGEGAHYCTFSADANIKAPLVSGGGAYDIRGIKLSYADQRIGYNNYAAASIDHCSFHHMDFGIDGTAQQLRITDNTFDYLWRSAIELEFNSSQQGYFSFTPMYVERNNITVRGSNPRNYATTYGIVGGVYAQGNYIHGDDASPASNSVEQVGMFMSSPDNSTQTGNIFERLDKGIEASVDGWFVDGQRDISGNLFRDVVAGVNFYTGFYLNMANRNLHVRCNSFENPGNLSGAVALNIEGPGFVNSLGSSSNGNGNRFVTRGLPFIEPINNPYNPFFYFYIYSVQEDLTGGSQYGSSYYAAYTATNPTNACTGAGYANGITNRASTTKPLVDAVTLQNAYDSLRVPTVSPYRQNVLLGAVTSAVSEQENYAELEAYLVGLPSTAARIHSTLSGWLLQQYRTQYRESDAQRIKVEMLRRNAADPEVRSYVQLSDVLTHLNRNKAGQPLTKPVPADVAVLRAVAASGTASARIACVIARRYEPACPCRFASKPAGAIMTNGGSVSAQNEPNMLSAPYPNPADHTVRLHYALSLNGGTSRLEVRNSLGKLVYQENLSAHSGEVQLSTSQLAPGLYHVTLLDEGRRLATQPLAIVR